ncbi:MAG: hypothetical protein IT431_14685 [Phycisphaerales bacterium]|nr:hypothetical protein [Phycisphaerales bacterium]
MTTRAFTLRAATPICAIAAMTLGGCATSGHAVNGRVLTGRASVVTVVPEDDARLDAPGVADVTIRITRGDGTTTSLAETVTGPDGSFRLRVDDRYLYSRLELVAQGPTVLTCRGSLYPPTDDRRVLVLVEPAEPEQVGERAR